MKLETGNNLDPNIKEISIQILLDGFSLFDHFNHNPSIHTKLEIQELTNLETALSEYRNDKIHAIHLTPVPLIVPTEIITNANNSINTPQNYTMIKEQIDNVNIMYNTQTSVLNNINNCTRNSTHNHPLALTIRNAHKNTLSIVQQHNCTCFVLTSTIALLEAVTVNNTTEEDILYYIKKLMPTNNISIITDNPQTIRLVTKYYKLQNAIITASPFSTLL